MLLILISQLRTVRALDMLAPHGPTLRKLVICIRRVRVMAHLFAAALIPLLSRQQSPCTEEQG